MSILKFVGPADMLGVSWRLAKHLHHNHRIEEYRYTLDSVGVATVARILIDWNDENDQIKTHKAPLIETLAAIHKQHNKNSTTKRTVFASNLWLSARLSAPSLISVQTVIINSNVTDGINA